MKGIIIFTFTLLATLSIVNAINLHKRATNFMRCTAHPATTKLLTVTISPDPLIPGEYSTFKVSGDLWRTTLNSDLVIAFSNDGKNIRYPFTLDVCKINSCPADYIDGEIGKVYVPAVLPKPYVVSVFVVERTAKSALEALGCAEAVIY